MQAGPMKLLALLKENKSIFNIPVYQRNYEWNKDQVEQFFRDIEGIIRDDYNNGHFLGTIVFVSNEKQELMMERIIIDGQQRITTTVLLLKAIHDSLDESNNEEKNLKEEIYETYIINKYVDEKYKLKLKPVEEDMKAYVDLIESNQTDEDSKIYTNYKLLMDLISNSDYNVQQIYKALSYVQIVYISLDKNSGAENPQLIFESLNSTGLSLTEADLIRNFILMGLEYDDQVELYRKYWINIEKLLTNARISEFVRDYLTMKIGYVPNRNKVYVTFKKYYFKNNYNSKDILIDLLRYTKYYHWFINLETGIDDIDEWLWRLENMKSTVVYPYLLELFDDYFEKKIITKNELLETMNIINSYLYRRTICNIPTNALNKVFASMAKSVSDLRNRGKSHIEAVTDYLMSKSGSAIFPRNEQFKKSFIELDIYNRRNKLALFTLYNIEKYQHKEIVELDQLTVEHIMPKTLTPKWYIDLGRDGDEVHKLYKDTIGNLTITKYNSEMSNKSFEDKKDIYMNSNIKLTRDLTNFEKWDKDSIISRANSLFKIANKIWPLPVDNFINVSQENLIPGEEYSILDNIDVTGYKPTALIIDNEKIFISSWKEMLIEMSKFLLEFDRELFYSLLDNKNFKKLISNDANGVRKAEQLAKDLYIETNLSANDILNYVRLLNKEYDMEEFVDFTIRY
ncbi:uncharacterized protein with ParB-like and HNH nuclease domain [Keratinibaculum paraultunense]|uniref:Uncharacterized protein with ParB-like and HNH nuclease domain n=2 Tax=Keratinibaculum paraultunense TaxID=1278232 RepID=A0A4R3L261_9FIRM|nr:uncharacterized protein with ParB-like and HNH nuclease domain [Keratinibaculum paraultunense]